MLSERIHADVDPRLVCKFREMWLTENSARAPAFASARIAPKICQSQLQTMYSEYPKFHQNPFTSERVNVVETHHKVFSILGEATASSPSNNFFFLCSSKQRTICDSTFRNLVATLYVRSRSTVPRHYNNDGRSA